jgi:formiminotetrahydrofolate cyclodeaminase
MALLDLRLNEFLEQVASANRTPGGGSVAAVVTAASAGLLAKVARASADTWIEARGVAAQAEALRDRVAPIAQIDADEYEAALLARTAGGDPEVGRAYARAAEPPLQIVEVAADVALLSVVVAARGDPSLRADAATAAALAAGAARAAAELVAVNLTASSDDDRVIRARKLADEAARAAEEALGGGG